mmetsp:Transcript_14507/g.16636  ORF Transcript_14507/g.16636 Transcript_14507/m.16636 type:complete len:368 (-) Transcript_14507:152-1255(-)
MIAHLLLAISCLFSIPLCESFGIALTKQRKASLPLLRAVAIPEAAQLLEFTEPQTGTTVVLVGAMHYNPSSVKLASDTVKELGENDQLGTVIVESCETRWNKTEELYQEKPFLKTFLSNEMRTASDMALSFNRPVVLGDQNITLTGESLKASLRDTIGDLATPGKGWKRLYENIRKGLEETAILGGEGYLTTNALLDPKLILALPVSLIKYPISFLVRDPIITSIFLTFLAVSAVNDVDVSSVPRETAATITDYISVVGVAALETIVFARLLLEPLLAQRNLVLAKSILDQCKLYSADNNKKSVGLFDFFMNNDKSEQLTSDDIVYAAGSPRTNDTSNGGNDKVVVAILGMAHCNGIMKILQEQQIR